MKSLILKTAAKYLLPLLLLFSGFLLLRGHYLPGGGFVGGLVAAIAFILHAFATDTQDAQRFLKYNPGILIPMGLTVALTSGVIPLFHGYPLFTGMWLEDPVPVIGLLGTPLLFDIGVFLVVIGVTITIIFTIAESD